jgi:hypothetical protein
MNKRDEKPTEKRLKWEKPCLMVFGKATEGGANCPSGSSATNKCEIGFSPGGICGTGTGFA